MILGEFESEDIMIHSCKTNVRNQFHLNVFKMPHERWNAYEPAC